MTSNITATCTAVSADPIQAATPSWRRPSALLDFQQCESQFAEGSRFYRWIVEREDGSQEYVSCRQAELDAVVAAHAEHLQDLSSCKWICYRRVRRDSEGNPVTYVDSAGEVRKVKDLVMRPVLR